MAVSDEELIEWLKNEDEITRPFRKDRLRFLVEEFGQPRHLLIHGGVIAAHAFEEARLCYLSGQFIGCILLSQILLEHTLAGLFRIVGRDDLEGAGFKKLLTEALRERFISASEYKAFNSLRSRRNPYVHSKPPMHEEEVISS